jgi:quercetin dioxygenase-like cupin family protein
MRLRHWDPAFDGPLTEDGLRRKLEAMGYVVRRAAYPPHHTVAEHKDAADTIEAVVSGRLRVIVAGHFAVLGPGDHVTVARGAHHSAAAVGDEPVVSLVGTRAHAIVSGRDNGM